MEEGKGPFRPFPSHEVTVWFGRFETNENARSERDCMKNNTTRQTETFSRLLMRSRQKKYSLANYLQTLQQFAKWQRLSYEGKESYKVHRTFQRIHIVRRVESKGPYGISAEKT